MTLTTKEFQDLRDILFPGGRLGFVWVLLHSFFNHILQADLLEVMWYATGTASKLRKMYSFLILWACRLTKGTTPPESKLFYTCKCWCICWSGFQSPGLRWGLCLCQAMQLALEQQCAELGAACGAEGAVSLCILLSKPKGSIYWLRWVGKNYSDLLHQCLDLKVVIQSSAKPDTILLVLTVVSSVLHQVGRCNYSMVQRSRKGPHGSMLSAFLFKRKMKLSVPCCFRPKIQVILLSCRKQLYLFLPPWCHPYNVFHNLPFFLRSTHAGQKSCCEQLLLSANVDLRLHPVAAAMCAMVCAGAAGVLPSRHQEKSFQILTLLKQIMFPPLYTSCCRVPHEKIQWKTPWKCFWAERSCSLALVVHRTENW